MFKKLRIKEIKLKRAFKIHRDFDLEKDFRYPYHLTPYQGCTFGCVYCFNTKIKKYWRDIDRQDNQIVVAKNIVDLVKNELSVISKNSSLPLIVRIGTEAEIYGPVEKEYRITRGILEQFTKYPQWKGEIPTKSDLVLRDLDLLKQLDFHVTITIVTTNEDLAAKLEPYAPIVSRRIEVLRQLRQNGIKCRIRCEPYLEGISDVENLLKIKEELGLEKVKVKPLNYYTESEIKQMIGVN